MTRTRTALLALAGLAVAAAVTTTGLAAHPAASSTPAVGPHRVDLHMPVTPSPVDPAPTVGAGTDLPAGTPAMDSDPAPQAARTTAPARPRAAAPSTTPTTATATEPIGTELQGPSMCTDPIDCPSPYTCAQAGEDYDGTVPVCVARQLPAEVIGRALTCGDGQTGYVIDAALDTNCSLPAPRPDPVG